MLIRTRIIAAASVMALMGPSLTHAQSLTDSAAARRAARMTPTSASSVSATQTSSLQKLNSEEELRINAVEKAENAVVSLIAKRVLKQGDEPQLVSAGSAFFVSADGYLITNYHVIDDASSTYVVVMNTGDEARATIVETDTKHDIALLHIDRTGTPYLPLAKPGDLRLAQTAICIGNALGEYGNTVSVGIVSALRRAVTAKGGGGFEEKLTGLLQTDAAINSGVSGGPILNLRGEVIGMIVARDSNGNGIGFGIPADRLREFLKSHLKNYK